MYIHYDIHTFACARVCVCALYHISINSPLPNPAPLPLLYNNRLVDLMVKASISRAEDLGFESRLCRDFSGVESYQSFKNWHSSGYPVRRMALKGQCWDWLARCQYTVTGRDGKFDLQLLSQCGNT